MSNLHNLSPNSNRVQSQELSASKTSETIKQTAPNECILLNISVEPDKGSNGVNSVQSDSHNTLVIHRGTEKFMSSTKDTLLPNGILHVKTEPGHFQTSNSFSKPEIISDRSRPKSSRSVTSRASFSKSSREGPRLGEFNQLTSQNIQQVSFPSDSHNKRTSSRISLLSLSAEDKATENTNPDQRGVSCDSLLPRRSRSTQSRYHEGCFPKEDPALIIGSPYRIQSARDRRTKSAHKRPTNRRKYIPSEFTNRESVVNIVYTVQTETEQDELSRARAETERDARALRSGGLSSGSFSQGFFNQTNRWASPAQRQRRANTHTNGLQHNMAGTPTASCEYPTVQEDDCSNSRYSYSRQSCSPDDMDGATLSVPGLPTFRPASQRSFLSTSRQTDSPQSESGQSQRTPGFLYQMVAFDNLADNVPTFVRQNVKKTGRMQTESFILRLNYLRRRRALGETSGTINNNTIAKTTLSAASSATGGITASPRTG